MLFKKRQDRIIRRMGQSSGLSYWSMVRQQFKKNRLAIWSIRVLMVLLFIAIFADFLANDKPLYCKLNGTSYFPVLKQYAVDAGWTTWDAVFVQKDWNEHRYEASIFPLIPYSAGRLDLENILKGPFDKQSVASKQYYHWLGTDQVGRDVAAGMIHGTRIALTIGIIAMGIATIIGLFFGGLAGYFGDDRLQVSRLELVFVILGIGIGFFYGFITRAYALSEGEWIGPLFLSLAILIGSISVSLGMAKGIQYFFPIKKRIALPIDILVMRLIEVLNSIPALIFLLSILAIIESPSIINVMIIIGLISWTGIARFVRAELLRVRALDYIEAARSLGLGDLRILIRHALPNTLTPVLIAVAFGIAGAILVEAFISFLGIGVPPEEVTWGKLLNISRNRINAWWLAIFPGVAIFLTVTIFNLIGEGLTDALNPKLKQ